METCIVQSISKEQYLYDVDCLKIATEMRYNAAMRIEVAKSYKRTGDFLFVSCGEMDERIAKWQRVYNRINTYCKNKSIKILSSTI